MIDKFFTIKEKEYIDEIVEKKSKFIAKLVRVNSEEEAISELEKTRKEHRNAKHNVFVYRIANLLERVSDDGEPSGTAGVPILDILRGTQLQNVLVVVTRYFGGILLGTGGLVKAYSTVTKNIISKVEKIELKLCNEYEIEIDYSYHNTLLHYLNGQSIIVRDTFFSDKVHLFIIAEVSMADFICDKILEKTDRTARVILKRTDYY